MQFKGERKYTPVSIPVDIEWRNLVYTVRSKGGGKGGGGHQGYKKKKAVETEILHGINGCVKSGEFVAVMGPSGSGKTSLLNALSSRTSVGVSGDLLINGENRSKAAKRVTGYVMQRDIFFEYLTVFDTLRYTALLRMSKTLTKEEKISRVRSVMEQLGLTKCSSTIIGNAFNRGISGGELKRLNIANELLFNPSLLILDEPTSGLDSSSALALTSTLKEMAEKARRTIICSIHQPSSQIFAQFDRLILMMGGHIVYQGDAHAAYSYFSSIGHQCPVGFNMADYLMDLLNEPQLQDKLVKAYAQRCTVDDEGRYSMTGCVAILPPTVSTTTKLALTPTAATTDKGALSPTMASSDNDASKTSHTAAEDDSDLSNKSSESPDQGEELAGMADPEPASPVRRRKSSQHDVERGDAPGCSSPISAASPRTTYTRQKSVKELVEETTQTPPYWELCAVLWQRALKTGSGGVLTKLNLFQCVAVATICGLLWWQNLTSYTEAKLQDRLGILFFINIYHGFIPMFSALTTFPPERSVVAKERAAKSYPISSYFLARSFSDLPIQLVYPLLFLCIVYPMVGMPWTAADVLGTVCTLLANVLVAHSFGLLVSALCKDFQTGAISMSILMLLFMLSGGYYVDKNNIPLWISWVSRISFIDYTFNALLALNLEHRRLSCAELSSFEVCSAPGVSDFSGREVMDVFGLYLTFGECIAVLAGFFIVLRFTTYLVLRFGKLLKLE